VNPRGMWSSRSRRFKALLLALGHLGGCAKSVVAVKATALPEVVGFVASAEERTTHYARRVYARGSEAITVTLAWFPLDDTKYAEWVRMSTEAYPQATLDVGPAEGNGFYQCHPDQPDRCDLLIQLRCGPHIEIRGVGTALKAQADQLAKALDLAGRVRDCQLRYPATPLP